MKAVSVNRILCIGWLWLAGLIFFSCDTDTGELELSFKTSTGYTYATSSVCTGQTLLIGVRAEYGGESLLSRLLIEKNGESLVDTLLSVEKLDFDLSLVKTSEAEEEWVFLVEDDAGNSEDISLTLNRNAEIVVKGPTAVGFQESTTGSFYCLSEDKVFQEEDAAEKADSIDIIFYYNSLDPMAELLSPDDEQADDYYSTSLWEEIRSTRFYPVSGIETASFDTLSLDWFSDDLPDLPESSWQESISGVQENDLYFIRTGDGFYGILKITELSAGTGGGLTLELKMQEE